jgi:hypothetical protein
MLTRRTFLQSGLLTFYIPAGNWLSAALSDPLPMPAWIITATGCSDTRAFTGALPVFSETMDLYRGENLHELAATLEHRQRGALAGLTRHSEFILISQIAAESGYKLIYSGTHHYGKSVLDNQLEGKGSVVAKLAEAFAAGQPSWPREYAGYIPDILRSDGPAVHEHVRLNTSRPPDSPGYLVSWAFRQG